MLRAFPKIFAIGTDYISSIFEGNVEITEKVDGSQFVFGNIKGELFVRSKGKQMVLEAPEKMFRVAVDYALKVQDKIPDNTVFYCEYLQVPHHNVLNYERTPKNNLVLFAVSDEYDNFENNYKEIKKYAKLLDIDIVPLLYEGEIKKTDELLKMLETDSYLGGQKVEGIVVKNYDKPFLLGGQPIPLMAGKFVSEKFKEVHKSTGGREHTGKGRWETFKDTYATEARWNKAIQHLKEKGELTNTPKDIGKLIIEIQKDIGEEEKETIKKFLWKEFGKELLRRSGRGFPEYYKEKLMKDGFDNT